MRHATKSRAVGSPRVLAAGYAGGPNAEENPYHQFAHDMKVRAFRGNRPPCDIQVGDRVTIGGLQEFKVTEVYWSEGWQSYFIHGRFGACKFYMLEKDVRRVKA